MKKILLIMVIVLSSTLSLKASLSLSATDCWHQAWDYTMYESQMFGGFDGPDEFWEAFEVWYTNCEDMQR